MALFQHRDGARRVALFQDSLIPKGEEALRSLQTAYQSGKGGFLDLIDAQRALLEFQLQAARAHTDRAQALAKIEQLSGVSLHQDK
jgi:outer membrane protein TolC